jgi:hypothetical protein
MIGTTFVCSKVFFCHIMVPALHVSDDVHATGFCTTVVASPVDVVKTRYMNSARGEYRSAVDCTLRMLTQEGPAAFYKGWVQLFVTKNHFKSRSSGL